MKHFFSKLFSPKVDFEAILACVHKLPEQISVSWKRQEGFIIGEISYNGFDPIYTQARTPKEFVKMVNDAVYISLDFKPDCIEFLHREKDAYLPTDKQWEDLNNGKIAASSFGLASNLARKPAFA